MSKSVTAVVLAAGKGSRMESSIQKQYMELEGRPLICYALEAFEQSGTDKVILVVGRGEIEYCRHEIVEKYGYKKVTAIVEGGKERYHSVYEGLKAAADSEYVLIHDGARPCVTERIISDAISGAEKFKACVIGMPVKDTIKIADENGDARITPDRRLLWTIQTPQAFSYKLVKEAYDKLFEKEERQKGITDDAMVVETMTPQKVHLIKGSYENIKVTTPEDLDVAAVFLKRQRSQKALDG